MSADIERQRRYEQRFAEIYGKPIDELTDRERKSTAVFEAHRAAVTSVLSPTPPQARRDFLHRERERFEARMRRADRIEAAMIVAVLLFAVVAAVLRLA